MIRNRKVRKCEMCKAEFSTDKGYKYCVPCRKVFRAEMYASGYLQRGGHGHRGQMRGQDARENTYETKHGTGH